MNDPFAPRVGGILSADIAVPKHPRELRFYSRVLTTGDDPLWQDDLMNNRGMPIIGLGERTAEYDSLPLQWMPHIQVADIETSVARTRELGGHELMYSEGKWAVLRDPNGAAFGIIPVVTASASSTDEGGAAREAAERVGCISSISLTVSDAAGTRDFYQQVVGWTMQNIEMDDGNESYTDYIMLGGDGNSAARINHARGANAGLPPVWLLHLPVGDLAESLRRVREDGGEIIKETNRADGAITSAVLQDPVGACLALVAG